LWEADMKNPKRCPMCNGTGEIPMSGVAPTSGKMVTCPVCNGVGYVERAEVNFSKN
jgi:DnaJ-class molecular chaperone